jgi:hypothetical protein
MLPVLLHRGKAAAEGAAPVAAAACNLTATAAVQRVLPQRPQQVGAWHLHCHRQGV